MFLNLIMLAGIAGAAVPLILHLLARARCKRRAWGAMMFLDQADPRQRHSTRLRQWILLAVRMATVALLAVALARPVIASRLAIGQPEPVTAVILLDHSGSMAYGRAGHTRMDEARGAVREILATLTRGDEAALVTMGDSREGFSLRPTADLQSISDALDEPPYLTAGRGAADIAGGLKLAADIFDHQGPGDRALFIVCDRQAVSWHDVSDAFARAWRKRMAPRTQFLVVPVGGWESDNLALESITLAAPQLIANQPGDVEVTVHNFGATARAAIPLTIDVDDRVVAQTTINAAAGSAATVRQTIRARNPGSHVVTARIQGAGATGNDSASLAFDVVDPIDVLILRGAAPSGPDYLKLALMPFASAGQAQGDVANVQIQPLSPDDDLSSLDSRIFRVVVLDGLPDLTPAQARSLEQHVYGGGGLLISPTAMAHLDHFNSLLYRDGAGVLPAALGVPSAGNPTAIGSLDLSHPIFHFLNGKTDPIPPALIARYFPAGAAQPDAQVLGRYATGEPFVIANNFGRGHVVLVTTPLNQNWSTLSESNFYLPMVQSIVRYLAAQPSRNLAPGEPIVAQFDGTTEMAAQILTPSGRRQDLPLQPAGDLLEGRFTDTNDPGIYTVSVSVRRLNQNFVVNPPQDESDLTPLPPQRWNELASIMGFHLVDRGQTPIADALGGDRSPREWWAVLLGTVLALGVGEIFLGRLWSSAAHE